MDGLSGGRAETTLLGMLACNEVNLKQAKGMLFISCPHLTACPAADGYVRSEACALVLLSSQPATEGGSGALVLLAGSAVNQGGRASSLTAPNGPSQQEVVRMALDAAGGLRSACGACSSLIRHWLWNSTGAKVL